MKTRWREGLGLAILVLASAYFIRTLVRDAQIKDAVRSFDIYSFFYPIMVLTARSVWDGGRGLFWNPYQDCGQPLFGGGLTGILYPPGILSLIVPPDWALFALLCFNLAVGAIATYFLCKEIGTGKLAAWCGALTFGFSTASVDLITFTPLVSGPYAWFPAAMFWCERLLRQPTLPAAVGLGACVALALAPGHPQAVLYLYQVIALRVGWQLITQFGAVRMRTLALLALGVALGPLFCAVQFVPYLEVMANSIRNTVLQPGEIRPGGFLTWTALRRQAMYRWDVFSPFMLVPFIVGSAALVQVRLWRHVVFYGVIGLLCLDLALGTNGWVFPTYMVLPFGALFRDPSRFLWVTVFCIAVLVALGVDALVAGDSPSARGARRIALAAAPLGAAVGFSFLANGLRGPEWIVAGAAVGACLLAALWPRARPVAGVIIAVALLLNLVCWRRPTFRHLLPSGDLLFARAELFQSLRAQMTPQDRIYLSPPRLDFSLQHKTGSLFGVPSLFDYESVPSRRYAEYFHMMRTGEHMWTIDNWLYPVGGFLSPGVQPPLLNLTGARFLVVDKAADTASSTRLPLRLAAERSDVRVYENLAVMPRAFYVPRIEVVREPKALLSRMATGQDDLNQVALVEEELPSGFRGSPAPVPGAKVEFVRNDPEHVEVRVHASQRGFLFLADQYFPGWFATVNGTATPIRRANYAFRLIEVPEGDSVVDFRYRPLSVEVGALVSLVTCLAVAAAWYATGGRRRPTGRPVEYAASRRRQKNLTARGRRGTQRG